MNLTAKHRLTGAIVPIVTPRAADGGLDESAVDRLTELLAECGHGVFVLGTTGEGPLVPPAERRLLVERSVRAARGRVPVLAGISAATPTEAIEAGRRYLSDGVDAVVALLPGYFPLSTVEMQAYFEAVVDGVGGPVVLYNIPITTHHSVPVEVVLRLSERRNVIGFKDSERSEGRMEKVGAALGGRDDFALLMGVAALSVSALKHGYCGMVPSSANVWPERWRDLWEAALAGRWLEAGDHQRTLDLWGDLLQKDLSLGGSLAALKLALGTRCLCGPDMWPPLQPLPSAVADRVKRDLLSVGAIAFDAAR